MASLDLAREQLTTLSNISLSLTEEEYKNCVIVRVRWIQRFLSEALLFLPWGNWWCLGRTRVACHSKCSLMLPEPQYRAPKCAGLISQDPLESRVNISIIGMFFFFCIFFVFCYRWEANTYSGSKNVITIMDEDPAHPPARNQPALGKTTTGQDGNVTAERCQMLKITAREYLQNNRYTQPTHYN